MTDRKRESINLLETPILEVDKSAVETESTEKIISPKQETTPEEKTTSQPTSLSPAKKQITTRELDELITAVEKILEKDLSNAYRRLSPIAQQEFKLKGEQTARSIRTLLNSTKLKVRKIFHLILQCLKILPGINRFFLEQEAKIKTDRIILLHRERQQKNYALA